MSDPLPPDPSAETPAPADAPVPTAPADGEPAFPADPPAPGAQAYTAPALDAPQYELPAYAIPGSAAESSPQPPAAAPIAHAYATPAYAAPVGHYAPSPYALPGSPYAAPGADPRAAGAALPPYARDPASPPPVYPGAPGYGLTQPGGPVPPPGADNRPKTLAIIALVLAGGGVLLLLVASTLASSGIGWLSPLLLFAAFVLSLIALISRNQGGKGFGVGALLLSILGGILTVVVAVAWVLGSLGSSYGSGTGGDEEVEEYVVPGITAPGTDGAPDAGAQFAPPVQPTVSETAFAPEGEGVWWYAVVVDNPNADYVFDAYIDVHAYAADGSAVGSSTAYAMLLSGQTALVGYFFDVGDAQIASIDVDLPEASEATLSPADETGSFVVEGVTRSTSASGATPVTGTVSARFADDQQYVGITVLARAADGTIIAASTTYVDEVRGDGVPVPFEAWFSELPAHATLQGFAHR